MLGEFPDQGDDTLLPLSAIDYALGDDILANLGEGRVGRVLGVDVARFGSDSSCIAYRRGDVVEKLEIIHQLDLMALTGRVINAVRNFEGVERIYVDEIGVGAGLVDRLREQGFPVMGINVARAAQDRRMFANSRAEGYWQLRRLLIDGLLKLPNDLRLAGELADLKYEFQSDGRILMESKDSMKSRGGSSPDAADSVMLAVLGPLNNFQFAV